MASYEELYNMIHGENAYEESVKSAVGKAGVDAIDKARHLKNEAIPETKKKIDDIKAKGADNEITKKAMDAVKKVNDSLKPITDPIAGVATVPFTKAGEIGGNAIAKVNETRLKKKYADNPEKLEAELKKNIQMIPEYRSNVMAIAVWSAGLPLAIKTLGTADGIVKGIVLAGAAVKEDKELVKAVAKAAAWVPVTVAAISKLKIQIKDKSIDLDTCKKKIKEICDRIENGLMEWAQSDEPLYITVKKGPNINSASFKKSDESSSASSAFKSKIQDAKKQNKKIETVKECVMSLLESYASGDIFDDEFDYLLESVVGEYDYQYEAYL